MAVVDGEIDAQRLATLRGFAAALNTADDYLIDLAEVACDHLAWAMRRTHSPAASTPT
jgi:hypothetical protein